MYQQQITLPQNLFSPDRERVFTYYDRCAIALDDVEMKAVRLRIKIKIEASPLYRSQNLKYPYYKEFYGYMQTFFQNVYVDEVSINYTEMFVYDCWNENQLLAYQITTYIQKIRLALVTSYRLLSAIGFPEHVDLINILIPELPNVETADSGFITKLAAGVILSDGGTSHLNTFGSPINLLRFKFETGTVFKVTLESWSLAVTDGGTSPGNPTVAEPYDETNPNGTTPTPSGARDPNNLPHGVNPPPQSPIDPNLDPNDFADPPNPPSGGGTASLQGWTWEARPGQQSAGYAIGCPGASLAISIPTLAGVINPVDIGVKTVRIDALGRVASSDVLSSFPGFTFGNDTFAADASCGINGTADF